MWIGEVGQAALYALLIILVLSMAVQGWASVKPSPRRLHAGRMLMFAQFGLAALASGALIDLLMTENLWYTYVAEYTGPHLPLIYRIAAFWGGNAGSLLLWVFVLTSYGGVLASLRHGDDARVMPLALCIYSGITLFYTILVVFVASPFTRLAHPAQTGNDLNPLLQNPGMTVHPVNVYLGCIGFTVPYAYAMACLWLRRTDDLWLRISRRWSLIAWLFLGIGIVYGAHWSYEELGWGGYWAWDPVENASLLPWLTATAFLHTAHAQERRGLFPFWNVSLVSLTFLLTLFSTFLTRSGMVWSIHAFAEGPLGINYLIFIGVVLVFSAVTIGVHRRHLSTVHRVEAVVSRETGFLLNNVVLLAATFAVLWGTVLPLVSGIVTGHQMAVKTSFYNAVALPLGLAVLLLMAIGLRVPWRRASVGDVVRNTFGSAIVALAVTVAAVVVLHAFYGPVSITASVALFAAVWAIISALAGFGESVRVRMEATGEGAIRSGFAVCLTNRRRWGGYCVHVAFAMMAVGVIGSGFYHTDKQQALAPGESTTIGNYQLTFASLGIQAGEGTRQMYANLVVSRDGQMLGVMRPAATFYDNGEAPLTNIAIYSRPLADLYVAMIGTADGTKGVFDVHINPLVSWIWWGGYLMIAGTLFSLWPSRTNGRARVARPWRGPGVNVP
ncbi:MAG: cytochrome c biogenesis protein CcsA [Alicyclobacillus herbarius]|uniref:heme lyase CcmF/NrfE family subunit n=1 Tax=Alicyclobacillus herbarius TaxID=122960 RepID=UPI0023555620|nr:cytochrome c-type biogenesis CcmF C-terminal domain-containing protein [Alicyclobacillus herbarius]MCL6631224.1 cytochrome c biogenesis protein CcsA [Alicyclobacillus herbarius]